jgi:predicted amidohydrolase
MAIHLSLPGADLQWEGWTTFSPRKEIRPNFKIGKKGGPDGRGGLIVAHDSREGLDGAWTRTFQVEGGLHYRISASARTRKVMNPRANRYVEIFFHDKAGNLVNDERVNVKSRPYYLPQVFGDNQDWTKFEGIFKAPPKATNATVRLHLRWEPGGEVEWGGLGFVKSPAKAKRRVRLASVNFRPKGGKTGLENCRQFAPSIKEAAAKKADLVVLGECITTVSNPLDHVSGAEPIPGPSTQYLGTLANKHNLYIVTTLYERYEHQIYNTAVMLGPEGTIMGKYRKLCLARGEYRKGIAPGTGFPVFKTRFGMVGMMICFDVHMPEVARGLAANGAEIIAMPIMGGHPALAKARAIENQVYLVTSTYGINDDWMQSGVWDLAGNLRSRATRPNEVVIAEIDLAEQHLWRANMGDFKGRLQHERPTVPLPQ